MLHRGHQSVAALFSLSSSCTQWSTNNCLSWTRMSESWPSSCAKGTSHAKCTCTEPALRRKVQCSLPLLVAWPLCQEKWPHPPWKVCEVQQLYSAVERAGPSLVMMFWRNGRMLPIQAHLESPPGKSLQKGQQEQGFSQERARGSGSVLSSTVQSQTKHSWGCTVARTWHPDVG